MKVALRILGVLLFGITTCSSAFALSAILPIPDVTDVDMDKATLGNMLFHDKKLSPNGTVSCSS